MFIVFLALFVLIAIYAAFLVTLNNTLELIEKRNRETEPSSVWLMLIPVYNLIHPFFLFRKLTNSITAEYRSRGSKEHAETAFYFGLVASIFFAASRVLDFTGSLDELPEDITNMIAFVTWIVFWVQIVIHKRRIKELKRTTDNDSLIFN